MKKKYPFINPIIVTNEYAIIDGQNRHQVCEINNYEIEIVQLNFSNSQINSKECIEKIKTLKKEQSEKLDKFFRKNNISFQDRLIQCSSDDKIRMFLIYMDQFKTDKEFWEKLGEIYIQSSNNYHYRDEIIKLFKSPKKDKEYLMSKIDRITLEKLPNKIKIYRGMSKEEDLSGSYGISWTLKYEVAEMFATTYLHNYDTKELKHIVKELTVNKNQIVAYFSSRQEEEIIYF